MKLIKYYLWRRLRRMTIANDHIIIGDLYRGSGRFSGITVLATHGEAKGEFHFCGTAVQVDKDSDCPVGVVANYWPVKYFTWCEPREKIELHN